MARQITRVGAYGLLTRDDAILLCRISSELPHLAGQWTLPGGGVEFREHPREAMIREVREETGYYVRASKLAEVDSGAVETPRGELHAIRILYFADIVGGELRFEVGGTTDMCAWIVRREAHDLPLVELAELGLELAFA
ncbi:MAG: NUDIX domain-containing protein [Pseudomonadota bacterium]